MNTNIGTLVDNGDGTVSDTSTGLMWKKDPSSDIYLLRHRIYEGLSSHTKHREVHKYFSRINEERFAGYGDWRLPTLSEVDSLLVVAIGDSNRQAIGDSAAWQCRVGP